MPAPGSPPISPPSAPEAVYVAGEALIVGAGKEMRCIGKKESKRMIARILAGQHTDDADTKALFAAAFDGADFREGSAAFLERRPASFE